MPKMAASKTRAMTRLATATNKMAQMKKSAKTRQASAMSNETATKKLGLESSATRMALVDATEQLLREQGFAAITSRMIAAKAALKPQLIHYYFDSMDDLYLAVFRRGAEQDLERLRAAKTEKHPLRALWKLSTDPKSARFATEFITIANHSDAVRAEISLYAKKRRELQTEIIAEQLAAHGVEPRLPPVATAMLVENVARGLLLESALDISLGHEEMTTFVEACLGLLGQGPGAAAKPSRPKSPEKDSGTALKAASRKPAKRAAPRGG
jgi:AcrR family transcriptional regulator